mmetsp:Transcript_36979/g.104379  ORF Transcript_36979/g.104379 Transcript_36979/m.104379 type:complete len:362 (-) Transcript_36979:605-1690(-)|eukprot:CAMPEP_0117684810 /NCGR_PEP_ID=MMETSP0804-20121206/21342_1 /TAXON_ID=1074897 /ORGANISM="Tetraselmis astigmatica, Strain CCMP880" /LENGTH=361 /DNA_ID=CAMNT_0005495915 /DNA_START=200 /DNA_END=1285 /DNA_ORIENTATION=-
MGRGVWFASALFLLLRMHLLPEVLCDEGNVTATCQVAGCSGEVCTAASESPESISTSCVWQPEFQCYRDFGTCGSFGPGGECSWEETDSLTSCLQAATGANASQLLTCVVAGCNGEVCKAETGGRGPPSSSPCVALPEHLCYNAHSRCGAFGPAGECAWEDNGDLASCLEDLTMKPSASLPSSSTGSCVVGGCSSQLCQSENDLDARFGDTCEWFPEYKCFQDHGRCGPFGPDGLCAWEETADLKACLADLNTDPSSGTLMNSSACAITGCSSEVCQAVSDEEAEESGAGGCFWLPEFKCFQDYGHCGTYGPDEECAWEQTDELVACLRPTPMVDGDTSGAQLPGWVPWLPLAACLALHGL